MTQPSAKPKRTVEEFLRNLPKSPELGAQERRSVPQQQQQQQRTGKMPGIETLMHPVRVEFTGDWSKGPYMQEDPIPVWEFNEVRKEVER
jgi:hypothetical protein